MPKIDPQSRVHATLVALVESRQHTASRAEADDWLARGWNPFLPQKGNHWSEPSAFHLMVVDGGWSDWISQHKDAWPDLARSAFKKLPSGKLDGASLVGEAAKKSWPPSEWQSEDYVDSLELLLSIGLDPNGTALLRSHRDFGSMLPAVFTATRTGAERLLAAGADPLTHGPGGESCWGHWAKRVMEGSSISITDLDWMAGYCPPSWPKSGGSVGKMALDNRSVPVAQRLIDAGAGAEVFGLSTHEGLRSRLQSLFTVADNAPLLELVGTIAGWERVGTALHDDAGLASPARAAMFLGRVKCLGVLERHGLLGAKGLTAAKLAAMGASCWEHSKIANSPGGRSFPHLSIQLNAGNSYLQNYSGPQPAGLAWAMGRLPVSEAALAETILLSCVKTHPLQTSRLVQTCASKGLLPDSGPASLRGLYRDGATWSADSAMPFSQFTALCEDRAFKKAFKPKAAKKSSPPRKRL